MAGRSLASRTVAGATWLIAWRLVTRALGLVSTLILARILLPTDFGLIAMATTFSAGVDALSQLGLSDALVRRRGQASELFDTAFTLQLCRAALTALILVSGAPFAVAWFHEPRLMPVVLVLAGGAFLSGWENIGIVEFRREMQFGVQFQLLSLPRLIQVAATITFALVLRSYWALLAGMIVRAFARVTVSYMFHPHRPRFRLQGWRELAGFSFWTWATALAIMVWNRCDPFILGPALGPTNLGLYLLALELGTLPVTELIQPVADALFVGFASAQHDGVSSTRFAPLVVGALFLGVLPLVIAISAASGPIVTLLLGPNWAAAQGLLAILVWQCLFSAFSFVGTTVLVANGHVRRNFVANLVASLGKLAVLLVVVAMTRRMAVMATATSLVVAAESIVFVILLKGTGEIRLRDMLGGTLRGLTAGAATIGVLVVSGLGWRMGTMSTMPALFSGAAIFCLAILLYTAIEAGLWIISGRPEGPESHIVELLGAPLTAWLRRLGSAPREKSP